MTTVLIDTVSRWELAKIIQEKLRSEGITAMAVTEKALKDRRILRSAVMWSFRSDLFIGLWDNAEKIEGEGSPILRNIAAGDERPILDIFPEEDPEETEHILEQIRKAVKK